MKKWKKSCASWGQRSNGRRPKSSHPQLIKPYPLQALAHPIGFSQESGGIGGGDGEAAHASAMGGGNAGERIFNNQTPRRIDNRRRSQGGNPIERLEIALGMRLAKGDIVGTYHHVEPR